MVGRSISNDEFANKLLRISVASVLKNNGSGSHSGDKAAGSTGTQDSSFGRIHGHALSLLTDVVGRHLVHLGKQAALVAQTAGHRVQPHFADLCVLALMGGGGEGGGAGGVGVGIGGNSSSDIFLDGMHRLVLAQLQQQQKQGGRPLLKNANNSALNNSVPLLNTVHGVFPRIAPVLFPLSKFILQLLI